MIRSRSSASSGAFAAKTVHEQRAVLCAQRLEQQRRRIDSPPPHPRADVEELRARDAEEEDRRVAREVRYVLHEIDEDRLRPLQVVDDHDPADAAARARAAAENELGLGREGADHRVSLDSIASTISTSGQCVIPSPYEGTDPAGRRPSRPLVRGSRRRGATPIPQAEQRERRRAVGDRTPRSPPALPAARARVRRAGLGVTCRPVGVADDVDETKRPRPAGTLHGREGVDRLDGDGVPDRASSSRRR